MNPYRANPPVESTEIRRRSPKIGRRDVGYLFVAGAAAVIGPAIGEGLWAIAGSAAMLVVGIGLAAIGRSRTPHTRLCALVWNRRQRLDAVMLFFNVIQLRHSAKRIARNRAAVAAASARCGHLRRSLFWP
jgi:hypothetical protein